MLGNLINSFLPRSVAATVQTLGHPAAGIIGWTDPEMNQTGQVVTRDTALTVAAFWCGVRIISETLGTLPCILYRTTSGDSRERAKDDPRYALVHDEPHPALNPMTFFETATAHVVCTGNAYARIVENQAGEIVRLEPRLPENITVTVPAGSEVPRYENASTGEVIESEDMLHVLGLGGDGVTGWSVLKYGANAIGGAMAAEQRANTQFKNGAMPGGALIHPMRQTKEARESLRREWNEIHGGSNNAGKIAILHGGMDFKPFSMSNEDAQFLESRLLGIRDIARLLRVPLHMLMDLENSSVRANIEAAGIEFLVYSMAPWIVRWQQSLNRKLLTREERGTLYFEFLLDSLMRGDVAQRYGSYATGRQWGWMSVNDIRRKENMNAIEGGDVYLQPANMVPAGTMPETVQNEMQNNLAASLSEIVTTGKLLRDEILAGQSATLDALDAANHYVADAVKSLREDRELIRRDISEMGKTQVRGYDVVASAVESSMENVNSRLSDISQSVSKLLPPGVPYPHLRAKEKAFALRAAEQQITRGESFIDAVDKFYEVNLTQWRGWCEESKRRLIEAADGPRDTFVKRINDLMANWEERPEV